MPSIAFALRNLLRDFKSGELAVLVLALLVAVASLTAVGFFTSRIGLAVERQAGEVLAADLRLQSARPVPDTYEAEAASRGLKVARLESMPSVVFFGQESSLIALRAVGEGYPLRGRLKTTDRPFGTGAVTDGIPAPGEAWADSRLLAKLGVRIEERKDGFSIHGGTLKGGACEAHGDHRLAMSLALAGLAAPSPVTVHHAEILNESFPDFVSQLRRLGATVREATA